MKTAREVAIEICDTPFDLGSISDIASIRGAVREKQIVRMEQSLRSYAESIREACAVKCEQTTKVMTRKAFQIAEEIRSIEIK